MARGYFWIDVSEAKKANLTAYYVVWQIGSFVAEQRFILMESESTSSFLKLMQWAKHPTVQDIPQVKQQAMSVSAEE